MAPALPAVILPRTIIIYPSNSSPFDVLRPLRPFSQTGSTTSTTLRSRARPLRVDLEGQPGRATLNFKPSRSPLADRMDTEFGRDSHWKEGFSARGCRQSDAGGGDCRPGRCTRSRQGLALRVSLTDCPSFLDKHPVLHFSFSYISRSKPGAIKFTMKGRGSVHAPPLPTPTPPSAPSSEPQSKEPSRSLLSRLGESASGSNSDADMDGGKEGGRSNKRKGQGSGNWSKRQRN